MTERPPFQVVQTEKLSQQITRQLLETIIVGHYRPGDLLPPERDLASMFQVSRAAVREALGTLAAKGFVSVRQGRGTTVNPPEDWNKLDPEVFLLLRGDQVFEELIEMRYIIEPEVAALAAVNITNEELEELRQVADLPDSDTVEQHVKRDTLFHLQITKATHNHILMMVLTSTYDLLSESRRRTFVVAGELPKARKWHQEIFEAIEKHDPAAARSAMQAHIQQVRRALQLFIEGYPTEKQEEPAI